MPGIVGLITKKPQDQARAELRRMIQTGLHESFYVCGTYANAELGIYVGWIARKGAFADTMPLRTQTRSSGSTSDGLRAKALSRIRCLCGTKQKA